MNVDASIRIYELEGRAWSRRRVTMMLLMRVDRWDARRHGPLTEAALRDKIEALGYDVAPRMHTPAATAGAQSDGRERIQAVVRGLIKVTVDGEAAILAAGDMVFVPGGSLLRVEAIGTGGAACFEAAYRVGAA